MIETALALLPIGTVTTNGAPTLNWLKIRSFWAFPVVSTGTPPSPDCLRRAAESPDTNALYLLSYAELCCKSTDPAAAIALTRRALALDGAMALGWFSLGSQLLAAREYAESRDCLERALELDAGLWQARCHPVIRQDQYGVPRYHYAAPGCDLGKYE